MIESLLMMRDAGMVIDRIQSFSTTDRNSASIDPVDLSRSFVISSQTNNNVSSAVAMIYMLNNDSVRIFPTSSFSGRVSQGQVVSAKSGIEVQHGTVFDASGTSVTVPITPVDVDRSLLLVSGRCDSATTFEELFLSYSLSTPTEITVTRESGANNFDFAWQVVEFV